MKVDMSAAAVTMRLKRVSQLRRLCLALGKAIIVATVSKDDEANLTPGPANPSR
jgi:hypothetical protein